MKSLFRSFLINVVALYATTNLVPALVINSGLPGILLGALAFMIANLLLTPFVKIILLPLNLLTVGLFAWLGSVLTLYILVSYIPIFTLLPYSFPGLNLSGVTIPPMELTSFQTAILVSFLIGFISHILHWFIE